jgi:hypothetical protein
MYFGVKLLLFMVFVWVGIIIHDPAGDGGFAIKGWGKGTNRGAKFTWNEFVAATSYSLSDFKAIEGSFNPLDPKRLWVFTFARTGGYEIGILPREQAADNAPGANTQSSSGNQGNQNNSNNSGNSSISLALSSNWYQSFATDRENKIAGYYRELLERGPYENGNEPGFRGYVNSGWSLAKIRNAILNSDERRELLRRKEEERRRAEEERRRAEEERNRLLIEIARQQQQQQQQQQQNSGNSASSGGGEKYVVAYLDGKKTLNLRRNPSANPKATDKDVFKSLSKGTELEFLGDTVKKGGWTWVKVRVHGEVGWCVREALKKI